MGHATDNPRTFLPCPVYRTDQFRADGKYDVRSRYGCGNGILLYVIDDRKLGGASVDLAMAKQSTAEKILAELQTMIDTLLGEQEMILMLVVLLAVFAVVFLARRMAMKHAWKVAIAAGTVIYLVLMMAGYMMLHLEIGISWI